MANHRCWGHVLACRAHRPHSHTPPPLRGRGEAQTTTCPRNCFSGILDISALECAKSQVPSNSKSGTSKTSLEAHVLVHPSPSSCYSLMPVASESNSTLIYDGLLAN